MKTIIVLIVVGILAGCSSEPPKPEWIKPGKLIANSWESKREGSAEMSITRDATIMGAACTFRAFLDGAPIADLRISQRVTIYPEAGEHIASVQSVGFCLGHDLAESTVLMSAGDVKRYRLSVTNGGPIIQPTAF